MTICLRSSLRVMRGVRSFTGVMALALLALALPTWSAAQPGATGLTFMSADQMRSVSPAMFPFAGGELPRRVDLSEHLPPPGSQGSQGSCTAWTTVYAMRSYEQKVRARVPLVTAAGTIDSSNTFSPAYLYNQLNGGKNQGISFHAALTLLTEQGVAPLSVMPYDASDHLTQPSARAREVARRYRIQAWKRVDPKDLLEVKSHLNAGYTVMIAAQLDSQFYTIRQRTVWADAGPDLGGHAMLVVGYDEDRGAFRVMNSWGRDWGDGGFIWITYPIFLSRVQEAFVAKALAPPPDGASTTPAANTAPVTAAEVKLLRAKPDVREETLGTGIRFDGVVSVPPDGSSMQVVVRLYEDDGTGGKGAFIRSVQPRFRIGPAAAATGTTAIPIGPSGLRRAWVAFLPYSALALSPATKASGKIIAEPLLYVDKFGLATGSAVAFACPCGRP